MHSAFGRAGVLVLLFFTGNCLAQSGEIAPVTPVFRANVLNPGLSYEFPVGPKQTVLVHGGLNASYGLGYSSSLGTTAYFRFDPIIGAAYRYYYNGSKRLGKEKRTALNSMNYLAPVYSVLFSDHQIDENAIGEEASSRPVHTIGAVWGFQRNFNSRFSLDLNLGGAYVFGNSTFYESNDQAIVKTTGRPTVIIQLQIGFWLNKR